MIRTCDLQVRNLTLYPAELREQMRRVLNQCKAMLSSQELCGSKSLTHGWQYPTRTPSPFLNLPASNQAKFYAL